MIKIKRYVIKDENSGLYVTNHHTLDIFGNDTRFYKSMSEAEKNMTWVDCYGMIHEILLDDLVYHEFECPWEMEITKAEFRARKNKYKLKVMKCEIRCSEI